MAYDLPILRKKLLPSLPEVLKAFRQADDRNERSRDTRPLLAILMRMVEADPRLGGHVRTRRTAITSFDWELESDASVSEGDEAPRLAARQRCAGVIETILDRTPEIDLYGALVMRLSWDARTEGGATGQGEVVPSIAYDYDPDEVERPSRRRGELRVLSWEDRRGILTRNPVPEDDPEWIAALDESHWTGGVLRSLVIRMVLLNDGLQEWARYIKKLKGLIGAQFMGEVPEEGDEDRKTAEMALQQMFSENYAMYSDRLKFELSKLVEAAAGGSFQAYKQELEADMAVAVLGQANTAQLPSGGGSRAALEILNLIRRDIHHSDIRRAERLCQQLFDFDYRLNVDQAAERAPWTFRVRIEQDEDHEANARSTSEAFDALDGTQGGLPAEEVYTRLGFTMPAGTPAVLRRQRP